MNNFEIFDNIFQTVSLLIALIVAAALGLKMQSRKMIVLACGYGSFMLGTLFYMLHLTIIGDIPRVFYVSEISWMAGYLFYLLLVVLREEGRKRKAEIVLAILAIVIVAVSVYNNVMGSSVLMSLAYGVVAGLIVYISCARIKESFKGGTRPSGFDVMMVAIVLLQNSLYFVSGFISDYTGFNMYFAIDILLTLATCSLLWLVKREVQRN